MGYNAGAGCTRARCYPVAFYHTVGVDKNRLAGVRRASAFTIYARHTKVLPIGPRGRVSTANPTRASWPRPHPLVCGPRSLPLRVDSRPRAPGDRPDPSAAFAANSVTGDALATGTSSADA